MKEIKIWKERKMKKMRKWKYARYKLIKKDVLGG